jgi:ATP-dependent exoDNAse (exonuclease V) beta subunit
VVWWAPTDLELGAQTPFGLRRDDLIVRDVPPATLKNYLTEYTLWQSQRAAAIAAASQPSVAVITATEAAARTGVATPVAAPAPLETIEMAGDRPGGVRFGTLVHRMLSDVPLDTVSHETLERLATAHGRVLAADAGEVAAATAVVARALAHPVLQAAAKASAAGRCYRETPVTLTLETGTLVEGHADLAFEEGEGFVVVDFKTDREVGLSLERYRAQVQIYADAIARATGRPARAVVLNI